MKVFSLPTLTPMVSVVVARASTFNAIFVTLQLNYNTANLLKSNELFRTL